jgi:hypothetical protein
MEFLMKKTLLFILIAVAMTDISNAQFKFGADLYSRYLWRGLDFGNSPSFQPSITYTTGGLSVGFWGAYALSETTNPADGSASTYSEDDFWASYSLSTESAGAFTFTYTDYYLPYLGVPFGFYKPTSPGSAAHTLEGGLSYTGPANFPISLAFYSNLSNDPDNSSYIQASYPFTVNDVTLTLTAGFTGAKSAYYGTTKGDIINLGINVAKSITITDKFALPINVSYINNPSQDRSYLVCGVSLTF